jgi:hypothetical protein
LEQLAELQRRSTAGPKEPMLGPLELRDLFAVVTSGSDSDDEGAAPQVNSANGTGTCLSFSFFFT